MNSKIHRFYKRLTAMLLAVCMVVGGVPGQTKILAYAVTELLDEDLGNGASEATAYQWQNTSVTGQDPSGSSWRFDLRGLLAGQYNYAQSGIKTTYENGGYATYFQVGSNAKQLVGAPTNGGVQSLDAYGIEVKIAVSPSPDNKYVFVDYYVYDINGQGGTTGRTIRLGTGTDVMIGGTQEDDDADLYKNDRGFHMVNRYVKTVFDCITNDDSLGVTPPDTRWIGTFPNWGANVFNESSINAMTSGQDSALAYSWNFQLHPYETVHKRVAFAIRATSYYVSEQYGQDSTSAEGTYSSPYKTIGYALNRIGDKKGYIYVMDYPDISSPINVTGSSQKDITIASTDYDHSGNPTPGNANYIKSLKRASGYTDPMFNVSGPTLKFTDITLDGNGVESPDPLLSVSSGSLEINSGATVTNCHGNASSLGSAVNVTGSGKLSMNFGTVSGNISDGKGTVYYNAAGGFEVINQNQISDNTTSSSKKANVYLAQDKYITVKGDLDDSVIGVTAEQLPAASPGGVSSEAGQEVKIAVPSSAYPIIGSTSPFADNFTADEASGDAGVYVSAGTDSLGNGKNTVLKRNGYTISFVYIDSDTGGSVIGAPPSPDVSYAAGDTITLVAPPGTITGYDFTNVTIDQGAGNTLIAETTAGADFGKITGTMPGLDVVITYEYTRVNASIVFEANGGTPQPQTLTGTVGGSINALLPSISRYGYEFIGWSTVNNRDYPALISGLPAAFPDTPLTYYAIFRPDSNVKFDYTVDYTNADGSVNFQSTTTPNAYSVEAAIAADKKNIHGYVWSLADSLVSPGVYNYDGTGDVPVGTFNGAAGAFSGKMPGQAAAVKYGYKVDRSNPNAVSPFTVKYVTANGVVVHAADVQDVFPEDAITAAPVSTYGYRYLSASITAGDVADSTDGNLVNAVRYSFDGNGNFTGIMPNQPVEITYLYEATEEGFEYKINYLDNDTLDARLKDITGPDVSTVRAATPVTAAFKELYGYRYQSESSDPASAGSFDAAHDYSGIMPNDYLYLTYRYDRDPSKWSSLTYRAGANGSLSGGSAMSPDVTALAGGAYRAPVLVNDGTPEGAAGSYTWNDILSRKLVPEAVADTYYRAEGWFIDTNGNGIMDNGEALLTADSRFTGPATVVAYFGEDPAQWVDIGFAAGAHGSIDSGEATSLHIQHDRTWADITGYLPAYTPEVNYLPEDWYDGDVMVEDTDRLVNGNTYTIRFYPDPAVFGTDVTEPDVSAGLDTRGKGRAIVYGTTQGYQYIITDLDGNIVDVVQGNISGRVYFEDLYPGTRYLVYEATGTAQAQPGSPIGSVTGTISAPAEVLIPVVETNYQVLYDEEHEGKTVLVIKPADPDSDYAILDKNGTIVTTPETGAGGWQSTSGNPASVTFSGLDYNEEYVVVARPRGDAGITAESKFADGSSITTDPGGELDIPQYVVETINGQVHSVDGEVLDVTRHEEAHKGDEVVLYAEATDSNGQNFLYWKPLVGTVPGMAGTINSQTVTFVMPDTNVVMTACYARAAATPSNATVTDEVRGGNQHEMALDPDEIESLEDELTTAADRILMDVNHADVTYKVVYKKSAVKTSESNAIKNSVFYDDEHEAAYHGAWGLNVDIERYVNGRKVSMATPSNATFNTYVQLDREDVDMMDYQLFSISLDPNNGDLIVGSVAMSDDPEETGGLFTFTAQAGMRYVLVYSRAYRVYFINNYSDPRYRYYFKVRRDEAPGDGTYSFEYNQVELPVDTFVDSEGIEFSYVGWSYREDRLKDFDPDKEIRRETYVYAFYNDNSEEVDDLRKQLEDAIKAAIEKSDDYFLTLKESEKIKEAIVAAMDVFDKTGPRATLAELLEALEYLEEICDPFDKILDDRYNHYDELQNNGNSGGTTGSDGWGSGGSSSGSSSGGGSGGGSGGSGRGPVATPSPFVAQPGKSYVVGTNGNWELVDAAGDKWAFVLNGGIRLTSIWARLDYANGDVNQNGWYHFNSGGLMDSGWFRDEYLDWYYCNTAKDGWLGKLKTGWHYDEIDKNWYYLDPATGRMATGWKEIEGKWYYFTAQNTVETYYFDSSTEKWVYNHNQERSLGSMYSNEMTPDGYQMRADGTLRE